MEIILIERASLLNAVNLPPQCFKAIICVIQNKIIRLITQPLNIILETFSTECSRKQPVATAATTEPLDTLLT